MELALILLVVLIGVGAIVYSGLGKPPRKTGPDATAGDAGAHVAGRAPEDTDGADSGGDGGGGD